MRLQIITITLAMASAFADAQEPVVPAETLPSTTISPGEIDVNETTTTPEPFKIISKPLVVEAKLGDTVKLPCEYKGRPESTYRLWFHDQNVISINEKVIYRKDNFQLEDMNLVVTVSKADLADKYICKFNDPEWSNVTHTILLLGPPVVNIDVKKIDLRENGTISIHCSSSSAPKPTITYQRKGSDEDLTPFVKDGVLRIPNASRRHAGLYECTAKNGHAPNAVENCTVNYEGRPDVGVAIQWDNLSSEKNKSVEITCKVTSEQASKVVWTRGDGGTVAESKEFNIINKADMSTLKIQQITDDLFDNYTCTATNSFGEGSESVEISSLPIKPIVNVVVPNDRLEADITLTTVSPFRVIKFILSVSPPIGSNQTHEIPVPDNNAIDADGKYTAHKVLIAGLKPHTQYKGTVVAVTKRDERSAPSAIEFTTSATVASTATSLTSSLVLLLCAVLALRG